MTTPSHTRCCGTCACYMPLDNPQPGQPDGRCLLNPPLHRETEVEMPTVAGSVLGKAIVHGAVQTEKVKVLVGFRPQVNGEFYCWQWRSKRCLPGETDGQATLRLAGDLLRQTDLATSDPTQFAKTMLLAFCGLSSDADVDPGGRKN